MKRIICIILSVMICAVTRMPVTAYAKSYSLSGTDMTISLDDSYWYVFTRDNIANNAEMESLGLTYEQMHNILYNNSAYMNAILYYENGDFTELLIRKKALDSDIVNLSTYPNDEIMELGKELSKKHDNAGYYIHESRNGYKFVRLEYYDTTYGLYLCEYVTIVNKDNYTLTFQSNSPYISEEYSEMDTIVDSIHFDVDTSLKEKGDDAFFDTVFGKALGGAVIGGLAGGAVALVGKKAKKKKAASSASPAEPWQ